MWVASNLDSCHICLQRPIRFRVHIPATRLMHVPTWPANMHDRQLAALGNCCLPFAGLRTKLVELGRRPQPPAAAAGGLATPSPAVAARAWPAAPGVSATTMPATGTTGAATATPFSLDVSQVGCNNPAAEALGVGGAWICTGVSDC